MNDLCKIEQKNCSIILYKTGIILIEDIIFDSNLKYEFSIQNMSISGIVLSKHAHDKFEKIQRNVDMIFENCIVNMKFDFICSNFNTGQVIKANYTENTLMRS